MESRMTVRLQPGLDWTVEVPQEVIAVFNSLLVALGVFLTPTALLAGVLGAWRLGVDLGWTTDFFIANGLWSHWQVWFALAIVLQLAASHLQRIGKNPPSQSSEEQANPIS